MSLENRYQFALTDLSTDTVTLTVPLDTGIKLYSYAYFGSDFSLSELENTATQAEEFGETSSFTISSGDTSKEISLKYFYRQMGGSIQGTELSLSTAVTTLAGDNDSNNDSTDGTDDNASFGHIYSGITTDGTNLYVAEYTSHKIRKIIIDNGSVSTFAGTGTGVSTDGTGIDNASFKGPIGITTDGKNLYVTEYTGNKTRKIVISTKVVTTLQASETPGWAHRTGSEASFSSPWGITTDGTNLYVAEFGSKKIRKIVIDNGSVSTLAGTGDGSSNDGTGTDNASFNGPMGITTDGKNLYVTEYYGHKIRKIVISTKKVSTLAGSTSGFADNDNGTSAEFNTPRAITTDGTNLYVADDANHRIRQIVIDNGKVTTLAGGSQGSLNGALTSAKFKNPNGVITDGNNLYVADRSNRLIRKIE